MEQDQDVFHIIASANGGADHPDNYDFVRGRAWNIAIGNKFDDINCYMVGKSKCMKAVAISKVKANSKGKVYQGPSAQKLYTMGESAMRDLRMARSVSNPFLDSLRAVEHAATLLFGHLTPTADTKDEL